MNNRETKAMLSMCATLEGMDRILNQTYCRTEYDKAEYLSQLFGVPLEHRPGDSAHEAYLRLAEAVLKKTSA